MMAVLWGTVILTSDITPGHQYRRGPSAMRGAGVCVDGDGDCKSQDFQPVRSDLCGSQCSNACVLSLWEAWSPCVVIRCGQGSRVRSRRVIGPPPPLGATCADLVQTEACPPPRDACTPVGHEGPSTEGRSWFQVGLWSICLPSASPSPASRSRLGHKHVSEGALWKVEMGWRRRDVTCVADDGFEISIQRCRQAEVPPVHQPCLLPRDCTVGLWGPWGPCSLTCRSDVMGEPDLRGAKSRLRSLLHPSLAGGQPCPPLVQMEECGALELEQLPICPQ
uniref:Spondin-like TSP1 domain-containing protein n=1 Tax=Eptatretus burgeri TaxID=7764 RepID=A0A8C4QBZ4_EPTBU